MVPSDRLTFEGVLFPGQDETSQPLTMTIAREPDYVKNTFGRLSAAHGPKKATEMIATVLLEEMCDVLKCTVPFDEPLYKEKLERLR